MDKDLGSLLNPNSKVTESVIAKAMMKSRDADSDSDKSSGQDASFVGSQYDDTEGGTEEVSDSESETVEPIRPPKPQHTHHKRYSVSKPKTSHEDAVAEKTVLLFKLDRLEKSGEHITKRYTLTDDVHEIRTEVSRLERDRALRKSIKFQQSMLISFATGIEFLNNRFDPFGVQLEGWSESVNDGISEYDDVFAELHDKYSTSSNLPPELKLVLMLGGSAFMFHMTNTMFKSMPGMAHVMKQNPGLAREVAAATANTMAASQGATPMGGLAKMFGGMFGQPAQQQAQPARPQTVPDTEDIFSELSYDSTIQDVRAARAAMSENKGTMVLDLDL